MNPAFTLPLFKKKFNPLPYPSLFIKYAHKIIQDIPCEERRQNEADGMHSSSELIFYYKKYKTIYNTKYRE
jgi:hypothetical protein